MEEFFENLFHGSTSATEKAFNIELYTILENLKKVDSAITTPVTSITSYEQFNNFVFNINGYIKFSTMIVNILIFLLILLIIINSLYYFFFKNISYIMHLLKIINMLFISSMIVLLTVKFYSSLKLEQQLGLYIYDFKLHYYYNKDIIDKLEFFSIFSSSLSDAIILLCFITGIICLDLLGSKNLFKNINNINIFFLFNIFVIFMVNTDNLLIMFISFEFLFLPTMYFVLKTGYAKKVEKANMILFY